MSRLDRQLATVQPEVGQTLTIGGLGVTFKVFSSSMGASVSIVEHTLKPKALGAAPHRHRFEDEISYVLEGQLAVLQDDELTIAGPGAYVVKPRAIFHTFWIPGTEPARFVEIIAPGGFEQYFAELAPLIPADAPPDLDGLFALAERYGLEFDVSCVPELEQKYGVSLAG